MSKRLRKNLYKATMSISLLAGISLYPLMRHIVNNNTQDFDISNITILGETYTKQRFYEKLSYRKGNWYVTGKDNKLILLDSLIDFRIQDRRLYEGIRNMELINVVDTVYVRYARGTKNYKTSEIVFGMGTRDSLGYIPSFGLQNYGKIKLRYFKADNDALQKVVDVYNDNYNCTYRHEYQHYLNMIAGINRAGQSYENKFVECCLDEISANVAQLKEQRKHYLENGGDLSFITGRFKFYRNGIKKGIINPKNGEITDKEKEFIVNGVFDVWMREKFDIYVKNNTARTISILNKTNYNGIQPDTVAHQQLMKQMFFIDGIDFYPYMVKREQEIKNKIPEDKLKLFRVLKKEKYRKMSPLDEMEKLKTEQGQQKLDEELVRNKFLASMRKILNLR